MRAIPSAPVSLAVSPKSGAVLAATENGVLRSTDDGASWSPLNTPQLASLVAWADDRTIAATITGTVFVDPENTRLKI